MNPQAQKDYDKSLLKKLKSQWSLEEISLTTAF